MAVTRSHASHRPPRARFAGSDGPDKLCIVLEYCKRGDLSNLLDDAPRDGHAWASPFFTIFLGITRCFEYLHFGAAGDPLLHRDLKPANVLISADMKAKVADFGCSRRFDTKAAHEAHEAHQDAVLAVELGLEVHDEEVATHGFRGLLTMTQVGTAMQVCGGVCVR